MLRLTALTALVMVAFAANSLLNRAAVGQEAISAVGFAAVRLLAGACTLGVLCSLRGSEWERNRQRLLIGAGSLTLYMLGFSLAYRSLDAGLGALVLFGVVQVTMFGWGLRAGARPPRLQVLGACLAFVGLAFVLWPTGAVQVSLPGAGLMALAGLGWGIYSLAGRSALDPLGATAANFCWAALIVLPVALLMGAFDGATPSGLVLAAVSGAIASGCGYAAWYRVLPQLEPSLAATVQLSVPIIALGCGALLLAEPVSLRLILGAAIVLAGILLVIRARQE